jgi:cytochrome c oxidase assembly protein subunit 11
VAGLGLLLGIMTTLVAFSVPLYRMFCAATGFGNTIEPSVAYTGPLSRRVVTVRFDATLAPGLPWRFRPVERDVKVRLGEEKLVFFTAENLSDQPLVGHATFNVTPNGVGIYFKKIQCFCFDDEKLGPGETVKMPVDFFVDPALDKDVNVSYVDTVTLSYTFFRATDPRTAKDLARFDPDAVPDPERGRELFAERCAACHSFGRNQIGPRLDDVIGRQAGTVTGYDYSPALRASPLRWSRDTLERWLADPRAFIPGARMPVRVLDASTRRDIVSYLAEQGRNSSANLRILSPGEAAP